MDPNEASRIEEHLGKRNENGMGKGKGKGREPPSGKFTYEAPPELNDEYFRRLQAELVGKMEDTLREKGDLMGSKEKGLVEKRLREMRKLMD